MAFLAIPYIYLAMKKDLLYWFLLLTFSFVSCSDNDTPEPPPPGPPSIEDLVDGMNQYPTEFVATDEADITFKATSSSPLYNYQGDVYVHIGVIEGSTWSYVPAGWEQNIPKCKATKLADNIWTIKLSPDIRSWFGVDEGRNVQKIGVIFRSADGSLKGLNEDYFITVEDDTFTPGDVQLAAQPSGTIDGININKNNAEVTFVLYDKDQSGKYKDYAYLIGDFNDWKLDNKYQMKRDNATGCWWYTLGNLDANKEYGFQYYVYSTTDGPLRLPDAYTEKVIDPEDAKIPSTTYPNLPAYPSNKTSGIISTFKIQEYAYSWKVNDFKIEDKNNLIIYEMLFRDFTTSGDIAGAMAKLDYLEALGINAIELMPIQEFDGNDSWGYNPCFYFAMDKAYGTKEMYKEFIDECHARGIAVILDVVYNHATGANPFAQLYWNTKDNKTAANNPWFNVDAPHPHSVFHDFNHDSPLVRTFVRRNLEFLLSEYKIDGFRFDLTKGFTQNDTGGDDGDDSAASAYDQGRIDILKDYNATIKAANPHAIVILEHFAVEAEESVLAEDGMHLWRNLNNAYCQTAMGWQAESDFSALTTYNTTMPFGGWVGYMESHDEERASYKQITWGIDLIKDDLAVRMQQMQVNSTLFLTVPGPKMIWQFGELGYDVSIDENGRTGKKPVKWEYYEEPDRQELYNTYSKLIGLRTSYPELFDSNSSFIWKVKVNDWSMGRFLSLKTHDGKGLVVVANFTSNAITNLAAFPTEGVWYDYMDGVSSINVGTGPYPIQVPAHSFYVYTNFQP